MTEGFADILSAKPTEVPCLLFEFMPQIIELYISETAVLPRFWWSISVPGFVFHLKNILPATGRHTLPLDTGGSFVLPKLGKNHFESSYEAKFREVAIRYRIIHIQHSARSKLL